MYIFCVGSRSRHTICALVAWVQTFALPISMREEQAALLQRLRKSRAVVRHGPAFLSGCLNLFGVETCSLGLLPFVEREIAGIAQAGIPKPQIGRASGRGGVCPSVWISVDAV